MGKIARNFVFILWILPISQLIPGCISSVLLDGPGGNLVDINIEQGDIGKIVPAHLVREYGYYFLDNNGFGGEPLICEFEQENLQLKYLNFASKLAKITSKLLLNINLENSFINRFYSKIINEIFNLEHINSNYYYFLKIQSLFVQIKTFKNYKLKFNEEVLESEIEESIDSLDKIIPELIRKVEQIKEDFCLNLYLYRFKGLKDVMKVVGRLLFSINKKQISEINNQFDDPQFGKISSLITGNLSYLEIYKSLISEINIKLEEAFSGCLAAISNLNIPLFGGDNQSDQLSENFPVSFKASFGNSSYKRSEKDFGIALDEVIENKVVHRMNCDLKISWLKEFLKSQRVAIDNNLSTLEAILQQLRSVSDSHEIQSNRYTVFKKYLNSKMQTDLSLYGIVADQINKELLNNLAFFASEFQIQLKERCKNLLNIFDLFIVNDSIQWWGNYFNYVQNDGSLIEKKLSELSKILDIAVASNIKANSIEGDAINLLTMDLHSKSFRDNQIPNIEYVLGLINQVQTFSKLNMLNNLHYLNNGVFMNTGNLNQDNLVEMEDSTQVLNLKHQYDDSCSKLKKYFSQMASNEQVQSALSNADKIIQIKIQEFRKEFGKIRENINSANVLFVLSIGESAKYNHIIELIEKLVVGEENFQLYLFNYLEMRSCMGHSDLDFSKLTSITPSISSRDIEKKIITNSLSDTLLQSSGNFLKRFDDFSNNQLINSVESIFEAYLTVQVYLSGSLSQMLRTKEGSEMSFSKKDINFLYYSIVRADSLLFKLKGIKPLIFPEDNLKGKISFLYSVFGSYVEQIVNLKKFIIQWNNDNIIKDDVPISNGPVELINVLNSSLDLINGELLKMFEKHSLTKEIERLTLEGIEALFLQMNSQECEILLNKLEILNKSQDLIESIANGESILSSEEFTYKIKDLLFLDDEIVGLKIEDKMIPWDFHTFASSYPAFIKMKKEKVKITHSGLDSGCTVAYLDKSEDQSKQFEIKGDGIDEKYDVVVIHCRISNVPGETISDFLKRRAYIKDSGSVILPEYVLKYIEEEFYVHYLAIDYSLKSTLETFQQIEAQINQFFILIPELQIDYFLNLDMLVISGNKIIIELNKDLIRSILSSLVTYNSELGFNSTYFLYNSKVMVLEFPIGKDGRFTKLRTVGKYSGFGGETPISFAIFDNKIHQDSSLLIKAQKGLLQSAVLNYVPIYKNLASFNSSKSTREYVWFVSERSHVLYMMLLRSGVERSRLATEELNLIYPVAEEAHNQLQISSMNAFFNSISRRRNLNNLFYDITKNKLFVLQNTENKSLRYDINFSEFVSDTQLFINMSTFPTYILDIPVYESEMSQATESYLSESIPRFCSSRRNYLDNSIIVNINQHFSYCELITYRLLINTINPSIKLKVRNLPSQNALRNIFSFGKELLFDIEGLRLSHILPILGSSDSAKISLIKKNLRLSLEKMIQYTGYSQLGRFSLDISPDSIGLNIAIPKANSKSIIKSSDEVFKLNGKAYVIIRYSEDNIISALSSFVREVVNGRLNTIFVLQGFDLKLLSEGDLPSDNNPIQIHEMKGVPIELVLNERLVRIYTNNYETENIQLVGDIMSLYQGFDLSIVTEESEYYYFNSLCWDSNNRASKNCSYIQVFRYFKSNMFEKLKLYQSSLNKNVSLSIIAEDGEILSLDLIGLNVITRFGGSVLFKGDGYYELYYQSEQYWDVCSFVHEFFKFTSEIPIKAINFDLKIKDIIFKPNFSECPIPEIPNLIKNKAIPHFITQSSLPQELGFVFTLYCSIRYQTLSIFINYFISKKKPLIKYEGINRVSAPESILEILSFFKINTVRNSSIIKVFLDEISLRHSEVQSAKMVANQIRSLVPNSVILGINTRGEYIF